MTAFFAFTGKEIQELVRTGKLLILGIIFILFGIMNPAIAKLTPWLMEMAAGSLEGTGITVTDVIVNDITSWTQFYKNISMEIFIFILMFAGIFTTEYQRGTLINMLTKGVRREAVLASKFLIMFAVWTAGYWLTYGITYAYNAYFWGNEAGQNLLFTALLVYLLGGWFISLIVLASTLFRTNTAVLLGVGGVFILVYLFSLIPTVKEYLPMQLMQGMNLITGTTEVGDVIAAVICTMVWSVVNVGVAVGVFNRKMV